MYHFRALTGHQNLSSATDEKDLMSATKMSGGKKDSDWFFVRNPNLGMRRTPPGSHRMCPSSIVRECSSLRRRDVATANRKVTLMDRSNKVELPMGSKGDLDNEDSTLKRSQDGISLRVGGRETNIPLTNWPKALLSDTEVLSGKPRWIAAMAER